MTQRLTSVLNHIQNIFFVYTKNLILLQYLIKYANLYVQHSEEFFIYNVFIVFCFNMLKKIQSPF